MQFGARLTLDQAAKYFATTDRARNSVERQQINALANVGRYATKVAQNSIRKVGSFGKPSVPGKPPKSRVGSLKKLIRFSYFQKLTGGYVVAGPTKITSNGALRPIGKSIPEALEEGAEANLTRPVRLRANNIRNESVRNEAIADEKERVKDLSRGSKRKVKSTSFVTLKPGVYKIQRRPYMGPAYKKTITAEKMQRWFGELRRLA